MAEETIAENAAPAEKTIFYKDVYDQAIVVNGQYIKDLSFEAPAAPGIFTIMQQTSPDMQITVNVETNEFEDGIYEVVLDLSARCTVGDDVGFILELEYAGLFTINVDDDVKSAVLMIECPRLIFPFARNILAEVSRDGGFPPVMLGPIDFTQLYQTELKNRSSAEGNLQGEATSDD